MNVGKTLFAQVMEFVPWKTFGRIVERHRGDAGVRTLGCADLFRVMAFAQLTWRESLRDIEACLAANQAKLFHMGTEGPACPLHAGRCVEPARLAHLPRTGSAPDRPRPGACMPQSRRCWISMPRSTPSTPPPSTCACRSVRWAPFRSTKAAIKLHTLLDLRGAIPELHPYHRRQDRTRSTCWTSAHRSRGVLRDGSRLSGFRALVSPCIRPGVLRHPRQARTWMRGGATRIRSTGSTRRAVRPDASC